MPDTTNDQRERDIFRAARAIEDPSQRAVYLEAACGADRELMSRVDSLLAAADEAGAFLESPPIALESSTYPRAANTPGEMIGPYKLLEPIGEGGFGVVYMADQVKPIQRRVALKIIKAGMDTKQVVARFEAERQALALMDHPNIARVLDAGTTEAGRPYFVMELVRGIPVTEYCDDRNLTTNERLAIFMEICSAVQHAHQKGIIHRDIKPSNILVSTNGDRPVPKVIDFGIAKATQGRLTDKTLFTQFRQFIGTPAYMSPEQAQMSAVDVDTRSDIYSLGVLLYELLTGKTPLDTKELQKAGYEELCRRIREDEAPKPSTRISSLSHAEVSTLAKNRRADPARLSGEIRGDLDWIVMKAVEKDRSRRYATADALAEDVQRHLTQQPVLAAPPSAIYRMQRLARRNRRLLLTTGAVAAALILGTTISIWQAVRATTEAKRARNAESTALDRGDRLEKAERQARNAQTAAEESEQTVRHNLYASTLANAQRCFRELNTPQAIELLTQWIPAADEPDLRGFEWRWLWNQCHQQEFTLRGHTNLLRDMSFSRDGKWLVTGACDGYVRLWNMETLEEVWSHDGGGDCNGAAISPDNTLLAALFAAKTGAVLWNIDDLNDPKVVKELGFEKMRFAPDNSMWSGGKQFDRTGELLRDLSPPSKRITGQAVSADGTTLAWINWDGVARIIDIRSETFVELPLHIGYDDVPFKGVAISPIDNDMIVTGCLSLGICIWNRKGELVRRLDFDERLPIAGISFSRDGDMLAVRQHYGAIQVVDTETWQRVAIVRPPRGGNTVAFSPAENDLLVAGGEDGVIRGWRVQPKQPIDVTLDHPDKVQLLRFSHDGSTLAIGLENGSVYFRRVDTGNEIFHTPPTWELPSGQLGYFHSYTSDFIAFSRDSRFAAIIGPPSEVSIWDLERKEEIARQSLPPPEMELERRWAYWSLEFSMAGDRLYAGVTFRDGKKRQDEHYLHVLEWQPETPSLTMLSEHATEPNRSLELSPDGTILACQPVEPWTNLHHLPQLEQPQVLRTEMASHGFVYLRFSPDGSQLASVCDGIQAWNVATGESAFAVPRKGPFPEHVSWSADGRRLAISDAALVTRIWDVSTQQIVATFTGGVSSFSPNGTILATGYEGSQFLDKEGAGRVTLYHAPSLDEIDRKRALNTSP